MSKAVEYSNSDQKLFERGNTLKKKKKLKKKSPKKKEDNNEENKEGRNPNNIKELEKNINENGINIDENFFNKNNVEKEGVGLMLTELLDIKNEKKEENEKNIFLKKKYQDLKTPLNLEKGINIGIKTSLEEIHNKFTNEKLKINDKNLSVGQILLLNKCMDDSNKGHNNNHSMLFLTGTNKILSKQNLKRLNELKQNENYLKRNIIKLEENQKFIESLSCPKENIVDNNIQSFKLKNIIINKQNLLKKLDRVNEQIGNVLEDEKKINKKSRIKSDFSIIEDYQEQYNTQLLKMEKKENNMRLRFNKQIKLSYEKRQKELDNKEKEILEGKMNNLKELKNKEKLLFLKRKKKVDEIMEKSKKYIKEKSNKTENDYRYFKYKEKYENEENKLIDKIKMIKKDPLVTKEELEELAKKIEEQKKLLQIDNGEKKKNLIKLWSCRSQTLPTYHHPLLDIIENEKNVIKEQKDIEQKKREYNDLEKKNYKPPKTFVSEKLKIQRERRLIGNMEKIKETELNNKQKLKLKDPKLKPLSPVSKKQLPHQLSFNEINNNYIDNNELNSFIHKKYKKILKPIYKLNPKPDKPIDYLKEIIRKKSMISRIRRKTNSSISPLDDNKNVVNIESMIAIKGRIDGIDNKIKKKQELLDINGGNFNNPGLVEEVGKLLINSVKTKLDILTKFYK